LRCTSVAFAVLDCAKAAQLAARSVRILSVMSSDKAGVTPKTMLADAAIRPRDDAEKQNLDGAKRDPFRVFTGIERFCVPFPLAIRSTFYAASIFL
jgi:hypothetical protein